jgi:hypothetical protein
MTDLEKLAEKVDKIDRRLTELEVRGGASAQGDFPPIDLRKDIASLRGRVSELERITKQLQAQIRGVVR